MSAATDDSPERWRHEGSLLLERNLATFRELARHARRLADRGDHVAAAAFVEMAAAHADRNPSGLFASPELERILLEIGRATIPARADAGWRQVRQAPRAVLHVASFVRPIGGLSRMIWRLIRQDAGRVHSVALTDQRQRVPDELVQAVRDSGGRIHRVHNAVGGVLARARRLREAAGTADVVVLHTMANDVVPNLAFADRRGLPPIVLLDHADHMFWLGTGISDIVAGMRESGLRLARERRGIEPDRSCLLPIVLEERRRVLPRAEAKQRLGLPADSLVLVSIARSPKYRTFGGLGYADAHVPFLERNERAFLIVVGAGERPDWSAAVERTGGRIMIHPERPDASLFHDAADIYVDSFPVVSITSLLEAGSLGNPLVTRDPFGEASAILRADAPGLTGRIVRARDLGEHTAALQRLADDAAYRSQLGEATRAAILGTHTGKGWQQHLEDLYRQATAVGPLGTPCGPDRPVIGEPDVFLPFVHGNVTDRDTIIRHSLGSLPPSVRLQHWLRLIARGDLRNSRYDLVKCWVPQWLLCRVLSAVR
jgi:hypothetical protein